MKRTILLFSIIFLTVSGVFAQENVVSWAYKAQRISATEAVVQIRATIDDGYHIYSQNIKPGGPNVTIIKFTPSKDFTLIGKTTEPKPTSYYDKNFKMDVGYFANEVVFTQKIKLKSKTTVIKGSVDFTACNDKACLPPDEVNFSIPVK